MKNPGNKIARLAIAEFQIRQKLGEDKLFCKCVKDAKLLINAIAFLDQADRSLRKLQIIKGAVK